MDSPKTPDELADVVAGPVLHPGSAGYAEECATYNLAVTHRPAVVVGATCAADVSAALRYAAGHDLPAAVLATGHQAIVPADGAVLITTRRMTGVQVDPARRRVRVAAGERWQAVVDAAAEHGLAPLAGSSPLVGVVGYTLGGGLSPMLGRAYGWAADHVPAIDVVTADGAHHRTGPQAEAELFNALLGGKSNLGVVTAIEFGLFPVERLYAGGLFFAGIDAPAVLRTYAKVAENAPDELTTSIAFLRLPPLPGVPELLAGKFVVHVRFSHAGSSGDGAALAEPLRAAAPVLLDTLREMPFGSFAEIHSDPVDPAPFLERTEVVASLPEEAVQELLELAGPEADCPVHFVELRHLGGALSGSAAHAAGHRDGQFVVWVVAVGMPAELTAQKAFADRLFARLVPWSTGRRYLNFMSTEDLDTVQTAYDTPTGERLRAAKRRYDPTNLLRLNHNIIPAENGPNHD